MKPGAVIPSFGWLLIFAANRINGEKPGEITCVPKANYKGGEAQGGIPNITNKMKDMNSEIRDKIEIPLNFSTHLPLICDNFFASNKKLIMLVGQFSAGKTSMSNDLIKRITERHVDGYAGSTVAESVANEHFSMIHGGLESTCKDGQRSVEVGQGVIGPSFCNVQRFLVDRGVKDITSYFANSVICHQNFSDFVLVDSPGFTDDFSAKALRATGKDEEDCPDDEVDNDDGQAEIQRMYKAFWRGVMLRADAIVVLLDQLASEKIKPNSRMADALQYARVLKPRVFIAVNKASGNPCRSKCLQKKHRDECGVGFSKNTQDSVGITLPNNTLFKNGILPQITDYVFGGQPVPVDKIYFTNWGHSCEEAHCKSPLCSCDDINKDEGRLLEKLTDNSPANRITLRATSLVNRWDLLEVHMMVIKNLQKSKEFEKLMQGLDEFEVDEEAQGKVEEFIQKALKAALCSRHRQCCKQDAKDCQPTGIFRAFDTFDLAGTMMTMGHTFLNKVKKVQANDLKLVGDRKKMAQELMNVRCPKCHWTGGWFAHVECPPWQPDEEWKQEF